MAKYKTDQISLGSVLDLDDDDGMVEIFMVKEGDSLPPPVTNYPDGTVTLNFSEFDDSMQTPPSPPPVKRPITAQRQALVLPLAAAPSDFSVFRPNESYNPNLYEIPSPQASVPEQRPLPVRVVPLPKKKTYHAKASIIHTEPDPITDHSNVECMCANCRKVGNNPGKASEPDSSLKVRDYPTEDEFIDRTLKARAHHRHHASDPFMKGTYQHLGYPKWKMMNSYTKGLPHDSNGVASQKNFRRLVVALHEHSLDKLRAVKVTTPLSNPSAAWSYTLSGAVQNCYAYSVLPPLKSDAMGAYMAELYAMSLTRDVPFKEYAMNPTIRACCKHLNELSQYPQVRGTITPYNLFRGTMAGDLVGPYISQFLYVQVPGIYGPLVQKYAVPETGTNYLTQWEAAVAGQSTVDTTPVPMREPRYIITGRDLASYVRHHLFEPYINVHKILQSIGAPRNLGLPVETTEEQFLNLGSWDIMATITEVGRNALMAVWNAKWRSLNLCPEAYGIEVERVFRDKVNNYGVSSALLDNALMQLVQESNGSKLLSQASPGGAPLYPSVPSMHATVAGASITVIKFFYDVDSIIGMVAPSVDGANLVETGLTTTIGYELDKLASNIGTARSWEGVNYHPGTIAGLKLGEAVAISSLQDLIHRYSFPLTVKFPKFSGTMVTISNRP